MVGRFGVEDLADRADAGVGEMRFESVEEVQRAGIVVRMDAEPCVDERSDEPRPHGALVIGRIARAQVAVVRLLVIRMIGRQRAQSVRSQQLLLHDIEDALPARLIEHRKIERYRENLVRAQRRVIRVDDIVEILTVRVPETLVE